MTDQPSITCPRCNMTSYHPKDIEEGYCGNCHWWTSDSVLRYSGPNPGVNIAHTSRPWATDVPTVEVSEFVFEILSTASWEQMDTLPAVQPSWWQRFKARFR